MAKYTKLDKRVLRWLSRHREGVTTALLFKALRIKNAVEQRHISRRFTQLEDRGIMVCSLKRTERICRIIKDPPETLDKKRWVQQSTPKSIADPNIKSIPANDSFEWERAGGRVERIENHWNIPCSQIPTGTSIHVIDMKDFD